ncbi:MAG: zinc ribbon domain-containing protein [Saprospiraceae bacterium]
MKVNKNICQSCGMPLQKDPNKGGTNADNSISDTYCSFCYCDGKFLDEGITLQEKLDKNVQMAVARFNMSEDEAKTLANSILPNLKRWKQ